MFEKIEKFAFRTPPCRVSKEMLHSLGDLLRELKLECVLKSDEMDIKTDDINQFIGLEWPCNISLIRIKASDSNRNIEMFLNLGNNRKSKGKVIVFGNDPIWVKGMGNELQNVFRKHQLGYSPITIHWQIRFLMSVALISFIVWQINHQLWKMGLQSTTGITELQLFTVFLLLSTWLLYPLNVAILWLFPRFELEDSPQKKVRKIFWFVILLLIGWIITEFLFPQFFA